MYVIFNKERDRVLVDIGKEVGTPTYTHLLYSEDLRNIGKVTPLVYEFKLHAIREYLLWGGEVITKIKVTPPPPKDHYSWDGWEYRWFLNDEYRHPFFYKVSKQEFLNNPWKHSKMISWDDDYGC